MPSVRDEVVRRVWRGNDPYADFPAGPFIQDLQGWGEGHPWLIETIGAIRPSIVVEVGVWKGASTLRMAAELKRLGIDGVVIAVDTWTGSSELWTTAWFDDLAFVQGRPTLQAKFMTNVLAAELKDYVVPLPLDSLNAADLLQRWQINPGMIHLDGGHTYEGVRAELAAWWPGLRSSGALIGDDYHRDGRWPGVRQAFDEFFAAPGSPRLVHQDGKCRVQKLPK